MANVFVGDLSYFCSQADLLELFGSVGPVNNALVKRTLEGDSRHYGFVEMINTEDVIKVVEAFDGITFMGRVIRVKSCDSRDNDSPPRNQCVQLHVSFLCFKSEPHINESLLTKLFSTRFGPVVDCMVKRYTAAHHPNERQSGYGFVFFRNLADAQRAIAELTGNQPSAQINGICFDCKLSRESSFRVQQVSSAGPSLTTGAAFDKTSTEETKRQSFQISAEIDTPVSRDTSSKHHLTSPSNDIPIQMVPDSPRGSGPIYPSTVATHHFHQHSEQLAQYPMPHYGHSDLRHSSSNGLPPQAFHHEMSQERCVVVSPPQYTRSQDQIHQNGSPPHSSLIFLPLTTEEVYAQQIPRTSPPLVMATRSEQSSPPLQQIPVFLPPFHQGPMPMPIPMPPPTSFPQYSTYQPGQFVPTNMPVQSKQQVFLQVSSQRQQGSVLPPANTMHFAASHPPQMVHQQFMSVPPPILPSHGQYNVASLPHMMSSSPTASTNTSHYAMMGATGKTNGINDGFNHFVPPHYVPVLQQPHQNMFQQQQQQQQQHQITPHVSMSYPTQQHQTLMTPTFIGKFQLQHLQQQQQQLNQQHQQHMSLSMQGNQTYMLQQQHQQQQYPQTYHNGLM